MPRSRLLTALALAAVAGLTALPEAPSQGGPPPTPGGAAVRPPEERPIVGSAALTPRIVLFGDTVRAQIDVVLDRTRVDPDSVRVATAFSPWEIVGEPERVRRDVGSTAYLRTTYVLRCLTSPCAPPRQAAPLELDPARIAYTGPGEGGTQQVRASIEAGWPLLTVYSRFATAALESSTRSSTPWRVDAVSLPAVSHPVAPGIVLALLLAGALLLVGGGAALVYIAWPRRAPALPPEPEPEPLPVLTPLEQALALLEDAAREDGAEERRRSLELVAESLEEWGDEDLAGWARVLAWSEGAPQVEETADLATRVRAALELELEAREPDVHQGNGRVA
ncbi:MAG TPA: hypothetical protein VI409_15260 [Gaiellaceae bacterium]|nr:hypothetical protein [Gaiellaceae bacterium]